MVKDMESKLFQNKKKEIILMDLVFFGKPIYGKGYEIQTFQN